MKFLHLRFVLLLALLAGCQNNPAEVSEPAIRDGSHLQLEEQEARATTTNIPAPVNVTAPLPAPQSRMAEPTHTVVVYDVPITELLFSLARDSNVNLDIDSGVEGTVTLNAVEQTLPALLKRMSESVDIRYSLVGDLLRVEMDTPILKNYAVDYLNMTRGSVGSVAVATQISATGQGAGAESTGGTGNNSSTVVESTTNHAFWQTLETNISQIVGSGDSVEGESTRNDNIIINRESGVIAVRATSRQHREVENFLNNIQLSTKRQVLIEATIAEVNLSDTHQSGIDWALVNPDPSTGVEVLQSVTDLSLSSTPTFSITSTDLDFGGNELTATLRALETFGDVSVMSSPKVMAMNNQTAILKVVDNLIYFTVEVNIDTSSGGTTGGSLTTFETEINTVPVGFVMSVTPFIDEQDNVILNVRPTISRVIDFVDDPNPALAEAEVISRIPVIQVREVESILTVNSGDIAVIGGLMQDEVSKRQQGVPVLQNLPMVGKAFRYDNNETDKIELVIFLRPTVVKQASLTGDLKAFESYLPSVN